MESKKTRTPNTTITRNVQDFNDLTGNIYESIAMLSKRANQIARAEKEELNNKIREFSNSIDTMEEIYENREQIEVVRRFEQNPKPTLSATQEYLNGEIYYRNPAKEDQEMQRMEAMENEVIASNSPVEEA